MALSETLFLARAITACERAVLACRRYALQEVPDAYAMLVVPNSSHDANLVPGEVTFPEDSLPAGELCLGPLDPSEFAARFWRAGRIPEWIDVNACEVTADVTLLEVLVCGRFTDRTDLLYHEREGIQPFHVAGPALPPGDDLASPEIQRFDVNWRWSARHEVETIRSGRGER